MRRIEERLVRCIALVAVLGCTACLDYESLSSGLTADLSTDGSHVDLAAACPTDAFCEDFEGDLAARWTIEKTTLTEVAMDGVERHGGTKSVRVTFATLQSGETQSVIFTQADAWLDGKADVWARVWVRMDKGWANQVSLFDFTQTEAVSNKTVHVERAPWGELALFNYLQAPSSSASGLAPKLGAWRCIEWRLVVGEPAPMLLSVDGTDSAFGLTSKTNTSPPLRKFELSPGTYGAPVAEPEVRIIWFDDLVLSTSRVGCGPSR